MRVSFVVGLVLLAAAFVSADGCNSQTGSFIIPGGHSVYDPSPPLPPQAVIDSTQQHLSNASSGAASERGLHGLQPRLRIAQFRR
jgi:hypothetical protein